MKEFIDFSPDIDGSTGAGAEKPQLPRSIGAVTIVGGEIISAYQDPAVARYLERHAVLIAERAAEIRAEQGELASSQTLLDVWSTPEDDGAEAFRIQNRHGK